MINQYSSNYSAKSSANFDNFIAIDSNQAAKSSAIEFALKQTSYNVLGISSSIGNGATHLALAILNEIEKKDRTKETFYSSFERLVYNRLYRHVKVNKILNPAQYGFQEKLFTESIYIKSLIIWRLFR